MQLLSIKLLQVGHVRQGKNAISPQNFTKHWWPVRPPLFEKRLWSLSESNTLDLSGLWKPINVSSLITMWASRVFSSICCVWSLFRSWGRIWMFSRMRLWFMVLYEGPISPGSVQVRLLCFFWVVLSKASSSTSKGLSWIVFSRLVPPFLKRLNNMGFPHQ